MNWNYSTLELNCGRFWTWSCLGNSSQFPASVQWNIPLWKVFELFNIFLFIFNRTISRRLVRKKYRKNVYSQNIFVSPSFSVKFFFCSILFMTHLAFWCILKCMKGLCQRKIYGSRKQYEKIEILKFQTQFISLLPSKLHLRFIFFLSTSIYYISVSILLSLHFHFMLPIFRPEFGHSSSSHKIFSELHIHRHNLSIGMRACVNVSCEWTENKKKSLFKIVEKEKLSLNEKILWWRFSIHHASVARGLIIVFKKE